MKIVIRRYLNKLKKKLFLKVMAFCLPVIIAFVGIFAFAVIIGTTAGRASVLSLQQRMETGDVTPELLQKIFQKAYEEHLKNRRADLASLVAYELTVLEGEWDKYNPNTISDVATRMEAGAIIEDMLDEEQKDYYSFMYTIYSLLLNDCVGEYEVLVKKTVKSTSPVYHCKPDGTLDHISEEEVTEIILAPETRYGIKAFYPLPEGFSYTHNNDFGNERTYGGERTHQGNDIMAGKGTPIIAVEDGTVESIGWNELGGYSVSIRSLSGIKKYYYAHMLAGHPYAIGLTDGSIVNAGDVIGFVGATGYSPVEGTSDLFASHLHVQIEVTYTLGLESGAVWINPYAYLKFLEKNRKAQLIRNDEYDYTRDKEER